MRPIALAAGCCLAALAVMTSVGGWFPRHDLAIQINGNSGKTLDSAENPRIVYKYSVIPGGVVSAEELRMTRLSDRVVEAHYADFPDNTKLLSLPRDSHFYISYRKGERVYWTSDKRLVPRGEFVLTDGKHFARARCGNRLSTAPMLPREIHGQPTEENLGTPELSSLDVKPITRDLLFPNPDFFDSFQPTDMLTRSPATPFDSLSPAQLEGSPISTIGGLPAASSMPAAPYFPISSPGSAPSASSGPISSGPVKVFPPPSTVPEGSTWLLSFIGLMLGVTYFCRRTGQKRGIIT